MSVDNNALTEGLLSIGVTPTGPAIDALVRLGKELSLWKVRGFVGDLEILSRHILDCAAGVPYISATSSAEIADLGSGAGFPGIVLAALMPERHFTLIESSSNRCAFLDNVRALAGLGNVTVCNARIEDADGRYDVITWRAFKQLCDIESAALKLAAPASLFVLYKGREASIHEELAASAHHWRRSEILPIHVPNLNAERNLLILEP